MIMKRLVVDIDGTICTNTDGKYEEAKPYEDRIKKINMLYEGGAYIIYSTARGNTTGINWRQQTESQLKRWGAKYHELICGDKPSADSYIDDKAIHADSFFKEFKANNIYASIKSYHELVNFILDSDDFYSFMERLIQSCVLTIKKKGTVIFAGNGGSMCDAMHITAELVGRFKEERQAIKAYSLGTNIGATTAISNDFGFENLFERVLDMFRDTKVTLICLSTSGKSKNIQRLIAGDVAKANDTFMLTSLREDGCNKLNKKNIYRVHSVDTAEIQQIHMLMGHILCGEVEKRLTE